MPIAPVVLGGANIAILLLNLGLIPMTNPWRKITTKGGGWGPDLDKAQGTAGNTTAGCAPLTGIARGNEPYKVGEPTPTDHGECHQLLTGDAHPSTSV